MAELPLTRPGETGWSREGRLQRLRRPAGRVLVVTHSGPIAAVLRRRAAGPGHEPGRCRIARIAAADGSVRLL